ncbi:MAG: dihydroorotase, partial [Parasphingorhabdus sp.]
MKTVFTNARLVLPGEDKPKVGRLIVDGDRIAPSDEGKDIGFGTETDCKGMLLAPGIVDLGVFAIDKPAFHFGGITRAALMPDQSPVLDLPAMIKH